MKTVDFRLGNKFLLADALKQHRKYESKTPLSKLLCDGYHYSTNKIYRNIRDGVLATGGSFTTEDYCHYRVFQGATLESILRKRKIIYVDNVTRLSEIEKLRPKRFNIGEIDFIRSNVHHESSHLLADLALSERMFRTARYPDRDQIKAFRIVAGEAIASTHDLLGAFETTSDLAGALYFSSVAWKAEKKSAFDLAVERVGFAGAYKTVFFGFLFAYMLHRHLDVKDVSRALKILFPRQTLRSLEGRALTSLLRWGNDRFIANEIQISNFYFRLVLKRDRNIFDLLGFDFLRVFEQSPHLLERLNGLAEIAQVGIGSKFLQMLEAERRQAKS